MQISEGYAHNTTRESRERAYWNEAYSAQGLYHEKYVWTKCIEDVAYSSEFFYGLLSGYHHKRILSLGGGVDRLAVSLAKHHNHVISVDLSPVAAAGTMALARESGVADRIGCVVANGEQLEFRRPFDVIVSKRALHHMDFRKVITSAYHSLGAGGSFIAEEPICLIKLVQWVHKKLPFHPEAPRTQDEVELSKDDLDFFTQSFANVKYYYFDFMTRESLAYFFYRLRSQNLLLPLGKLDYFLINRGLTVLKYLSSYAIIHAVK